MCEFMADYDNSWTQEIYVLPTTVYGLYRLEMFFLPLLRFLRPGWHGCIIFQNIILRDLLEKFGVEENVLKILTQFHC